MVKVLQINATANWGSTGRIAEQIGEIVQQNGWESYIAYGRRAKGSSSKIIKVGSRHSVVLHYLVGRFFDLEGRASLRATRKLAKCILSIRPDIIHLHNIHDHWLNYRILFEIIERLRIPVVWTFHDCWAFTGHCTHFAPVSCEKWKSECGECPLRSLFGMDRSRENFRLKKKIFTGLDNLYIVGVSQWITDLSMASFLGTFPKMTIYNGIDLDVFHPTYELNTTNHPMALFVSNGWSRAKGIDDIFKLRNVLNAKISIVIVGAHKHISAPIPEGIKLISRTNNVRELVILYNNADVFVNPTYADTFPTVNLEALACGTPVVTYNTGGSPEAIDDNTGIVVEQGNIEGLAHAIEQIIIRGRSSYSEACRNRAEVLFNKKNCYIKYLSLYETILNHNK